VDGERVGGRGSVVTGWGRIRREGEDRGTVDEKSRKNSLEGEQWIGA
jgi:hypothetical protein